MMEDFSFKSKDEISFERQEIYVDLYCPYCGVGIRIGKWDDRKMTVSITCPIGCKKKFTVEI